MRTNGSRQVDHLQERLARLEKLFDKVKADVGALKQQSQIAGTMPGSSGPGSGGGIYAILPTGQTLPAGTSNGTVMGSNGNVVLAINSNGTLIAGSTTIIVFNIAGAVTGPKALALLPMADGTYLAVVAPC